MEAVSRLQEIGDIITFDGVVWGMPSDLTWDPVFLEESILLFPDTRMLTHLKYWAVCKQSMMNMRHVLNLAIECNMNFHMAMKIGDLKDVRGRVPGGTLEGHQRGSRISRPVHGEASGHPTPTTRKSFSEHGGPHSVDR